ncbi:MAG: 4-alpha-glucanotransferase, partial [Humidesulfovibrio sp.]|nr:4-alpha-glucanotransferase [Humidesulfovibrio sp.]
GPGARRVLARYMGRRVGADSVVREFIRMALSSPARDAVIPAQDLLDLDASHRMNIPGTTEGNWGWRLPQDQLCPSGAGRARTEGLRDLCELFGRPPPPAPDDEAAE